MKPVEVRSQLVDALRLDLVGPDNGSDLGKARRTSIAAYCSPCPCFACTCSQPLFVTPAQQFTTRRAVPSPWVARLSGRALAAFDSSGKSQAGPTRTRNETEHRIDLRVELAVRAQCMSSRLAQFKPIEALTFIVSLKHNSDTEVEWTTFAGLALSEPFQVSSSFQSRPDRVRDRFTQKAQRIHEGRFASPDPSHQEGHVIQDQSGVRKSPIMPEPEFRDLHSLLGSPLSFQFARVAVLSSTAGATHLRHLGDVGWPSAHCAGAVS